MIWLLLIALMLAGAVGCFWFAHRARKQRENTNFREEIAPYVPWLSDGVAIGLIILSFIILCIGCLYTQDPGQASVIVSFTGEVENINYEPGLHTKALWSHRVEYDTRNNILSYVGTDGNNDNYTGGDVSGPQITFQDLDGVTGNIDMNVRYSVRGDSVGEIYNEYKTQQEFVNATLAPDVRSKTREILSNYSTSQVYGERGAIQSILVKTLQESWDKFGVDVEDVYLQEVRYPQTVVDAFTSAQSAKTLVEVAKAEQEQAKVEAETNKIKSQALSDPVLKEKLIEAIRYGTGTYILGDLDLALGVK